MSARALIAAPAVLLLALAGCTVGASGSGAGSGDGGSAGGGSTGGGGVATGTECMTGTWALDTADAAAQLGDYLATNGGINVTQSEASGVQLISFTEDGKASMMSDLGYTVSVQTDDLTMTLVQTHTGDSSGEWAWTDGGTDTIMFPSWEPGAYTIQTQVLIDGIESPTQVNTPSDTLASGSTMSVECSGDTLTTSVSESPFTHHWVPRD